MLTLFWEKATRMLFLWVNQKRTDCSETETCSATPPALTDCNSSTSQSQRSYWQSHDAAVNCSLQKQFLGALGFWSFKRARCKPKTCNTSCRCYWNANTSKVYSLYFSRRNIFQVVLFAMQMCRALKSQGNSVLKGYRHYPAFCPPCTRKTLDLCGFRDRIAKMPCGISSYTPAWAVCSVQKDVASGSPLFPLGDEFCYVRAFPCSLRHSLYWYFMT